MTNPPSTTAPAVPGSTATPAAAPQFQPPAPPQQAAPPPASPSTQEPPAPAVRPFQLRDVRTLGRLTRSNAPGPADVSAPSAGGLLADPLEAQNAGVGSTHSPDGNGGELVELKLDRTLIKELFRGVVLTVTEIIHEAAAKTEPAKQAELWLANDTETRAIGDPLANVAVRHGGGVPGSPDMIDLVKAGIGLTSYGLRHAKTSMSLRRQARQQAKGMILAGPEDEGAAA